MTDGTGAGELDFEQTLAALEEIVSRLDRDDVGLDEAIALFQQGLDRLKAANEWLSQAEGKVEELIQTSAGALETRPFSTPADPTD
jgi:exodeoxyribonuclease VII small subunit